MSVIGCPGLQNLQKVDKYTYRQNTALPKFPVSVSGCYPGMQIHPGKINSSPNLVIRYHNIGDCAATLEAAILR